jgi:enoyl-CoA hydratase/carnithine racemase
MTARAFASYTPTHFLWSVSADARVATITLNRPERKNPLTFESYAELRDLFRGLQDATDVRAVVLTGAGSNFCSGGDVFEIIEPLTRMDHPALLTFTRMTGDLVLAMLRAPQPIIAAVDGVAAGAGAILAMASDLRLATPRARTAFLFTRVGLAGCDMGACAILPRLIGQGRAADLLYTGRAMDAAEGERWGFYNALVEPDALLAEAQSRAAALANGPALAHAMTKRMLLVEWHVPVAEALEMEAQAQAACMRTEDFQRAFRAFTEKRTPTFEGN